MIRGSMEPLVWCSSSVTVISAPNYLLARLRRRAVPLAILAQFSNFVAQLIVTHRRHGHGCALVADLVQLGLLIEQPPGHFDALGVLVSDGGGPDGLEQHFQPLRVDDERLLRDEPEALARDLKLLDDDAVHAAGRQVDAAALGDVTLGGPGQEHVQDDAVTALALLAAELRLTRHRPTPPACRRCGRGWSRHPRHCRR